MSPADQNAPEDRSADGRTPACIGTGPRARIPHGGRLGAPLTVKLREAFTVRQDEAFLDECVADCARIADAIRAGTYATETDEVDLRSGVYASTTGEDLPLLSVSLPRRDEDTGARRLPPPLELLPALDAANLSIAPADVHPDVRDLALPAMLRAIDQGLVAPPHLPGWRMNLRLPTPWSPATVESTATDHDGSDVETCGPEADVLPTLCRLLVRRRTKDGRPLPGRWIWTLTTETVGIDARRLPDAMTTLRILAGLEAEERA